jgi:hypothetical protein
MISRSPLAVLIILLLAAAPIHAADHYIRADAPAGGDGTNWATAWQELPSALVRGDTYYLADGTYPAYTFNDANDGTKTITVCKATADDHGTDTGWQAAYGDGQALFSGGLNVVTGYLVIDGRVRNDDWAGGYGIKIDASGGKGINITSTSTTANHVTIRYVDIAGRGQDGAGSPANDLVYVLPEVTGLKFQYCWLHDAGRTQWLLRQTDDGLIEYCRVARNESTAAQHSEAISAVGTDHWTVRYNLWEDIQGTGIIIFVGDAWLIHGNVFWETGTPGYGGLGGNGAVGTWTGEAVTNARVHNNTFIACTGLNQGVGFDATHAAGNLVHNNLWYQCEKVGIGGATGDYNSWLATAVRYGTTPQAHDVVDADAADPFVDWAGGDFRLKAPSAAGLTLPAPFANDMLGKARGADGHWDRGALEYSAESIAPDGWQIVTCHGDADVLTVAPDDHIEPRMQGIREIRVTFTEALDPATVGASAVTIVGNTTGDQAARIGSVTLDGDRTLIIALSTALPDGDQYTVTVNTSLHTASGGQVSGDLDRRLRALAGDVDASGQVTNADVIATREAAGQAITPETARFDVDGSGQITTADMGRIRKSMPTE